MQTNKKWSSSKDSQRNWIYEQIKIEHTKYVGENNKLPMKKKKENILEPVWERILEREIWIPHCEYEENAGKMIDRLNRYKDE